MFRMLGASYMSTRNIIFKHRPITVDDNQLFCTKRNKRKRLFLNVTRLYLWVKLIENLKKKL